MVSTTKALRDPTTLSPFQSKRRGGGVTSIPANNPVVSTGTQSVTSGRRSIVTSGRRTDRYDHPTRPVGGSVESNRRGFPGDAVEFRSPTSGRTSNEVLRERNAVTGLLGRPGRGIRGAVEGLFANLGSASKFANLGSASKLINRCTFHCFICINCRWLAGTLGKTGPMAVLRPDLGVARGDST